MQGQDAVNTAKAFADALPLTGVILTKLDGDARGGAALSVREITGKPIKFAGVGEKLDRARAVPSRPHGLAHPRHGRRALADRGRAASTVDIEEAEKLAKKVKSGKGFDLEDFKQQIAQMKKMGGLAALVDKLPGNLGAARAERAAAWTTRRSAASRASSTR